MVAYRISDDEIINILKEKYISLINDCKLFDSGNLAGIKESCNKIRLLLHDTEGNSTSILTHLNKKGGITFLDSGHDFDPENLLPTHSLVSLSHDNSWGYKTKLNSGERKKVDFNTRRKKIILSDTKHNLSRKDIILEMANKDGVDHIDRKRELKEGYAAISRFNSAGWKETKNGTTKDIPDIHLFTLRQIVHELLISLGEFFPELENCFKEYNDYLNILESIEFKKEAVSNFKEKKYKETIASCDKSLEKNPNNLDVLNAKGIAIAELGDIKGAISVFLKAKSLEPNNIAVLKNLCEAYAIINDKENLLENAKILLLFDPQNKEAKEYINLYSN